jgi:hypothetical protein
MQGTGLSNSFVACLCKTAQTQRTVNRWGWFIEQQDEAAFAALVRLGRALPLGGISSARSLRSALAHSSRSSMRAAGSA